MANDNAFYAQEASRDYGTSLNLVANHIINEVVRAKGKHPRDFSSPHEAHSVIEEEFDEFWDEVKAQKHDHNGMRTELIQTAAMCVRALVELNLVHAAD